MSDTNDLKTSPIPESADEVSLMTQRARMAWDERLGLTVAATRHWRLACFGALSVALCAVIGVTWVGSQSKIQPYALALRGDAVLPMPAMSKLPATKLNQLYQQAIRDFIESARSVVMDVDAQKRLVTHAYAYLRPQTPAHTQLTQQFKAQTPFDRAQSELVKVEIVSVLPLSANAWQIEWKETISDRNGVVRPVKHFKATLTTEVIEPTTQLAINANPLGFFITSFNDVEIK